MFTKRARIKMVGTGLAVAVLAAGCGAATGGDAGGDHGGGQVQEGSTADHGGVASGETVQAGDAGEAVVWGDHGNYGVVMSHGAAYDAGSWSQQGQQIADNGMVALAVEDNSAESLTAAAQYLKQEYNVDGVALMGASAGGQTAIQAASENQNAFDQLVLLSPAGGDVSGLGDCPKLFIYSEDEGLADSVEQMAQQASGPVQTVSVGGSAHAQAIFDGGGADRAMSAIMDRLERFSGDEGHQ